MADKIFHTWFLEKVAPVWADKVMISDSEAMNQTKFTDIANLPISTATSTAIWVVQSDIDIHEARTDNPHSVTKSQVWLSNVDNTSDSTKNSATATLTNKTLTSPVINTPTGIVKADVGLWNVDNTTDALKPISTATQTALNAKQDTITGLTASGAELNILDGATLSTTELNYVDGVTSAIQTQLDTKSSLTQLQNNTKQDLALAITPNYDAISGAIVLDSSKNHFHWTISGATYVPNGWLNRWGVYDFDGVDDYIELNDGGSVWSVYTNGFTIIWWIKPDSDGEAALWTIIWKNAGTLAQSGYYYSVNANTLRMRIADWAWTWTNRASWASSITYWNWHHVTVTVDNTWFVTHYINAVQSGTPWISSAPSNITTTNATRIGNRSTATDRTFDWTIWQVRIISRVLTATEIANDYLQRTEIDNPPEVPRLTTAMRDVMSPSLWQQVYNTTTNKAQVYNGAWNDLY